MAETNVTLNNSTGETLYLCVQVNDVFQEWSLPNGGSQTINPTTTDVVLIQNQAGQCPG